MWRGGADYSSPIRFLTSATMASNSGSPLMQVNHLYSVASSGSFARHSAASTGLPHSRSNSATAAGLMSTRCLSTKMLKKRLMAERCCFLDRKDAASPVALTL